MHDLASGGTDAGIDSDALAGRGEDLDVPLRLRQVLVPLLAQARIHGSPPAISTVHTVLDRHGLVSRGRRVRYKAQGTALELPRAPYDLWCADYKGEFMLADRRYCYPLTITDAASRYLLCCDALSSTREASAFTRASPHRCARVRFMALGSGMVAPFRNGLQQRSSARAAQ